MGSFAFASGMSVRLYDSAHKVAGKMPAGLAGATILACSGFAAICGSTAATAVTIGRVALPEMRRYGYSRRLAADCIASYDPIWFGVVIVLVSQIAVVTPPVGVNVYVVKGIVPDVPITTIFRGTIPFLWAMVIMLGLVLIFPDLILWLPRILAS